MIKGGLSVDWTIPVISVDMYREIEFGQMVEAGQTTNVSTMYKTMDRKLRPVTTPLPEDNWEQIKGVATDPSLRDPLS